MEIAVCAWGQKVFLTSYVCLDQNKFADEPDLESVGETKSRV